MTRSIISVAILILLMAFSSCSYFRQPATQETTVHIASITVYCDEAFKYLIDQEIEIYEFEQPDQHIHVIYAAEAVVLKRLFTDSSAVVIVGRGLRDQEKKDLLHLSNIQAGSAPSLLMPWLSLQIALWTGTLYLTLRCCPFLPISQINMILFLKAMVAEWSTICSHK